MKIRYRRYIYHSFDLHQAEIQDDSCTYTPIKYLYKPHWLHKDLHYLPHTHWALKSMLTIKAFLYPACLMERPWPYSKQHCSYLVYILTSSWSVYSLIFEQMKRYARKNFRILKQYFLLRNILQKEVRMSVTTVRWYQCCQSSSPCPPCVSTPFMSKGGTISQVLFSVL